MELTIGGLSYGWRWLVTNDLRNVYNAMMVYELRLHMLPTISQLDF